MGFARANEHGGRVAVITGASGAIGAAVGRATWRASFITGQLVQPNGGQVMW